MPTIEQVKERFHIIGRSAAITEAIERALLVAKVDFSVLVLGESGAGKEFFPQIIHEYSKRRLKKYIAVNCGAIPEGTIDSELFGHVKGSFTGSTGDHKGYFEEANEGTIFLDEVAELPLPTQARLLRVLENGEFIKVGSNKVQKTNVRIVAATNGDLLQMVKEGRFRQDLYYRLSTVIINVPPLRERPEDIDMLVRKFTGDYVSEYNAARINFDESAKEMLRRYRWPGNVRELKNLVNRFCLFNAGKTLTDADVREYLTVDNNLVVANANSDDNGWLQERQYLYQLIGKLGQQMKEMQERLEHFETMRAGEGLHISTDTNDLRRETSLELELNNDNNFMPVARKITRSNDLHHAGDPLDIEASEVSGSDNHARTLQDLERDSIANALQRNHGRRKATAHELGISERTLYRKIKEFNLND